jgi:hypothetical protein
MRTPHASLTMIDRHYGHLARDGREHAIKLLDALNAPEFDPWTLVDVPGHRNSQPPSRLKTKAMPKEGESWKPSDGLEPSTPLLAVAAAATYHQEVVCCRGLPGVAESPN